MENQHRQIKGYRELDQAEIDLMNEIEIKGEELGALVQKLERLQKDEVEKLSQYDDPDFSERVGANVEARRWTQIGKTDLQTGLMALTRAVARPTFF